MLSLGMAMAKFSPDRAGTAFGLLFAVLGSALLLFSGRRYFEVMAALEANQFKIRTGDIKLLLFLNY